MFLVPSLSQAMPIVITYEYEFAPSNTNAGDGGTFRAEILGTLQADGDTIFIDSFISASFRDVVFPSIEVGEFHGPDLNFGDPAVVSLSGLLVDFHVCPSGFTGTIGGGSIPNDCPFGVEGGFIFSIGSSTNIFGPDGVASIGDGSGDESRAFERPYVQANSRIVLPACENPVTLDEVWNNVTTGFTVDPTLPQPSIIDAAQGQNVRGFVDVERTDVISIQCESDYFATYVWFGAGSAADTTAAERIAKVEAFVASVGEISVFVDEIPVESFVTPAVDGFYPNSTREPAGIIVAGYIVEPFELSPGVHRVRLEFGNFGLFADIPFVVVAATPTPDILLEQLSDSVISLDWPGRKGAVFYGGIIALAQAYYDTDDIQATCAQMQFLEKMLGHIKFLAIGGGGTFLPGARSVTREDIEDIQGQNANILLALDCAN